MIDQPFLYFLVKTITLIASMMIFHSAKVDITDQVISTLSFVCIFLLEVLIDRKLHRKQLILFTLIGSVILCFCLDISFYYPLFVLLLIHILEITVESNLFYQIIAVLVVLSLLLFTPTKLTTVFSMVVIAFLLIFRILLRKLQFYQEMNEQQKEKLGELSKKLEDIKSLSKTIKYTAAMEERNRIAARIHDQIGHGISGSIIMLEAALLIMKNNQEKAVESIQKAITNMREGVDEIRTALREERAQHFLIGRNDVMAVLEEFKVSYNIPAALKTSGDLDHISLEVWACIHDNLKECLTNLLKHSNATEFALSIEVFQKIIKVEYRDNGKSKDEFVKGLGLEAMEERTVHHKGRCFFNKGEYGFCVTNIFPCQ